MDTHMAIRSSIFLVAGLTVISFPKRVFTVQTRVITYVAEVFHLKFLRPLLKVEQEQTIISLIKTGVVLLITSAILFVWAFFEWGL